MSQILRSGYCFLAALVLSSNIVTGQSFTINQNWLTAASGVDPLKITFSTLTPSLFQLLAQGNVGVRWNQQFLSAKMNPDGTVEFTVPPEMRVPGIVDFVLWNTEAQQPLPYGGRIWVFIPTAATVFEADPTSDRVVAAVGADGTGTGTGGQVTIYQLSTGLTVQTVPVPAAARVLIFTPDTSFAWIATNEANGSIARLNLSTGEMDQPIQLTGGSPPYTLSAEVDRQDPTILIVSAISRGAGTTQAFANGKLLPKAAPVYGSLPLGSDDKGRFLLPNGQACELNATVGFTNCVDLLPGKSIPFTYVWKNIGYSKGQFFDLNTGNQLPALSGADPLYLPETNRLLVTAFSNVAQTDNPSYLFVMDGASLETYEAIDVSILSGLPSPRRIWSPDWILMQMGVDVPLTGGIPGILVGHLPELGPLPSIPPGAVIHAAKDQSGAVAPGEIVSIFGQNLGPATGAGAVSQSLSELTTEVEHTQVLFDGVAAAILYTSASQINAVVPETVSVSDSVQMQVVHYGLPSARIPLGVTSYSPGLFGYSVSGKTFAVALTPSGMLEGPETPLPRGIPVTLWGTGLGLPSGETATAVALRPEPVPTPGVTVGGKPAQVSYAGVSPGSTVGLSQLNIIIPAGVPTGTVEVVIMAGGQTQGNVWVAVQ